MFYRSETPMEIGHRFTDMRHIWRVTEVYEPSMFCKEYIIRCVIVRYIG